MVAFGQASKVDSSLGYEWIGKLAQRETCGKDECHIRETNNNDYDDDDDDDDDANDDVVGCRHLRPHYFNFEDARTRRRRLSRCTLATPSVRSWKRSCLQSERGSGDPLMLLLLLFP
ncbi:hypothetical protein ACLKA7_016080 [Drosophila subpalustris]